MATKTQIKLAQTAIAAQQAALKARELYDKLWGEADIAISAARKAGLKVEYKYHSQTGNLTGITVFIELPREEVK